MDKEIRRTGKLRHKYVQLMILLSFIFAACASKNVPVADSNQSPPNFIIIFTDDLGYGDLSCYGHPTIKTPNIDKMAAEGQRWTTFYVAANVCTPSRSGLMTGRLPVRNGMDTNGRRVFFPDSDGGLPPSEMTIASLLKERNYHTACIGKWHLGHLPQYLPVSHGFDYYYGLPYSNDMDPTTNLGHYTSCMDPKIEYFNVPLMQGKDIIERPADQNTITRRYTEEAVKFISENRKSPFFLYLAHAMPHVPLFASEAFKGKSDRGLFGDVLAELDWSVGQILTALKDNGIDKNTMVVFASDNGPWVVMDEMGGSAGPLYGAKATSYEGGMRVPAIFYWPGKIKPEVVTDKFGSTLDLLPTFGSLAGATLPTDRTFDGYDISNSLFENGAHPRNEMIFYHGLEIFAARKGNYKLYYYKNNPQGYPQRLEKLKKPELFNIQKDPSERFNVADQFPEVLAEINALVEKHKAGLTPVENQLDKVMKK